jgi:DNA primase
MEIPRLHPDTVEEVRQQVDIVDVIAESVVLRKRGKDYVGLCPFHDERTPSFSVSPSKQVYYCFGCGAGGNAVKFLMELGKRSFTDVVLELAQRYQISVKTLAPEHRQEFQRQLSLREQLYEILAVAASFYQHALRQPQGEAAFDYLKGERQFSEETIQQFQLGYAPGGWETLYRYLVEQKRYPLGLVEEAGLIQSRSSGSGCYDRFRDRVIIPILDPQGRIIAFGSRSLTGEEPKYLNSPETPLFEKGKTLFALDKAKQSLRTADRAVVVEGYFDAIALHAAGIVSAVASLGTAFSQAQLKQLLRYSDSKQIVFNFDADAAGEKAAQRAIAEIEPLIAAGQVQLRVLQLPDGKDADEFLKLSPDAAEKYRQLLQDAPLWFDWQVQQLLRGRDLKQADQFQEVSQNIVKLLGKIEHQDLRDHYISYCAQLLSQGKNQYLKINTQDFKQIAQNLSIAVKKRRKYGVGTATSLVTAKSLSNAAEKSRLEEAEALLLRIYIHCPEYRQKIWELVEDKDLVFSFSHHRYLWQKIDGLQEKVAGLKDGSSQLLSWLQDCYLESPESSLAVEHLFSLNEKTNQDIFRASLQIKEAVAAIERIKLENYRRYCIQQLQQLDPEGESERLQYYLQERFGIEQQINEFDKLQSA